MMEICKLSEIAKFTTGKLNSNAAEPGGAYPFFTCAPEPLKINSYAFDMEAIILAGNNAEGNFHIQYYDGKFNAYQRTYVIESCDKTRVNLRYLYYALKMCLHHFKQISQGTATKFLTAKILNGFELPIPEIELQNKIAIFLGELDEKIETNEKINKNLLEQAIALFEQQFVTSDNQAQQLPLYEFADYINGAAFKPKELGDVGLPVIKIAELKAGITDSTRYFSGNKGDKYLIKDKDILFSWSGNPDTSIDTFIWTHGDAILNQHTFNVKSKFDCPWFTFLLLKYHKPVFSHIASNKQTTGLGHVTAADLKRLSFSFDLSQMCDFEQMIFTTMELYYQNILENQQLTELRDVLLPRLMSGELVVSDIDL